MKKTMVAIFSYFVGIVVGIILCVLANSSNQSSMDMENITGIEATESGILFTFKDGTGYFWEGNVTLPDSLDLDTDHGYEAACNFMEQIENWNTNDTELSIITKDGYELYAYKD